MNVISTQHVVILMAHTHVPAILGTVELGESVVSLFPHRMSIYETALMSHKSVKHADREQPFL